jgi:hypothetical protein
MSEIGKYIYGIINTNNQESFGLYGISACKEVHFIPYQDIAAVVKDAEIVNYTHMFKDVLARALVEHQKIIERVMGIGCLIIPVRFGTFVMNEAEVKDILSKGYGLIKDIIPKISDKIEIDVVCTWSDFTSVIKEAGQVREIRAVKEKLLSNPEEITVDDQMRVGVMLKNVLDQMREGYTSKIQDTFKTLYINYIQHGLMDDKMVANIAFLINKTRQKEFYAKVEDLDNEFAGKLNFRCVGPLPSYSFFTLEIKKMQFNDVDWARKKLRILNDPVTKNEIKRAYQRQAFSFHPDKNPDKPGIEREFEEIKKSYNILLDYAKSCAQVGKESLYFNEDEFKKNAVLVKVRE